MINYLVTVLCSFFYLRLVQKLSVPLLKMCTQYTALVQKGNKDIIKVDHVTLMD